jgi:hypothetical protein
MLFCGQNITALYVLLDSATTKMFGDGEFGLAYTSKEHVTSQTFQNAF